MTLDDADVSIICVAIVRRAAVDYSEARKFFRMVERKLIAPTDTETYYHEKMLHDTERFFTSQWFYMMGGSPEMFKRLQREAARGNWRKELT